MDESTSNHVQKQIKVLLRFHQKALLLKQSLKLQVPLPKITEHQICQATSPRLTHVALTSLARRTCLHSRQPSSWTGNFLVSY